MVRPRRPPRGGWVYDPARAFRRSKAQVPSDIKQEVQRRAQDLIDSTLKPRHIQPPPKKTQFNYLVDIHSGWRGPFSYFCSPDLVARPGRLFPVITRLAERRIVNTWAFIAGNCRAHVLAQRFRARANGTSTSSALASFVNVPRSWELR
jgi:hypothetical protein